MAALKWENVNFEEKYIYIHESRLVIESKEYTTPPKTDAGLRKIFIPERLVAVLREYRQRYTCNKLKMGKDFADK